MPTIMKPKHNLTSVGDISRKVIDDLKERQLHPELYRPIPTGLDELDKIISGITEKMYMVIGGKHKSGKSSLALHVATALAAANRGTTLYFSLEEIQEQMGQRSLARLSLLTDRNMMRDLTLTEMNFIDLEEQYKKLKGVNLLIEDSISKAASIIEIAKEMSATFVVIDYMQLLTDKVQNKENETTRWDQISRQFIESRNKDKITYVVVYQIGKEGRAYGTSSIYRDGDLIVEIEQEIDKITGDEIEGELAIHVRRSRICKEGKCHVAFNGAHSRLSNRLIFDELV